MNIRSIQTDLEPIGAVAKLEADPVPFISLGEVTQAVILRLSSDLPRIRCETTSTEWRGLEMVSL
ncbi:hypothetical protein D9M72_394560 [compost metagenome]